MTELYKKHRPVKFSQIVGQPEAVRTLVDLGRRGEIPHAIMFSGPSGVGKTTMARILRRKLKCSDHDFREMNLADLRGIDEVRKIRSRMQLAPMGGGKSRVWLLDEAHKLTSDAQHAILKLLEDTPGHVYFILCTTEPRKLIKTIHTRCTEIRLESLGDDDMRKVLVDVLGKEGVSLTEDVTDKLVQAAEGSPRKALVLLHQVIGEEDEENQLEAIRKGDSSRDAIEVARALLKGVRWPEMAGILKGIGSLDENAESVRWLVLSYMSTVSLNNPRQAARACEIIQEFLFNFWDSKRAGLILACHDLCSGK